MAVVGIAILGVAGYILYRWLSGKSILSGGKSSGDQAPAPLDGKTLTTIPAANLPDLRGTGYGLQFWMYIADWDYGFGTKKSVLVHQSSDKLNVGPEISLHPSDNSLDVRVSVYPTGGNASQTPAPSNTSANGDSYTATIENVPLQSWFSVSVTVFQRNMDIYINGRLVKSAVLPGIPKPVLGDVLVGAVAPSKGFSGSVCNVHMYSDVLEPADAAAFFSAGTGCAAPSPSSKTTTVGTTDIFGYRVQFGVLDSSGNKVF